MTGKVSKTDLIKRYVVADPELGPMAIKQKILADHGVSVFTTQCSQVRKQVLAGLKANRLLLNGHAEAPAVAKPVVVGLDALAAFASAVRHVGGKAVALQLLEVIS